MEEAVCPVEGMLLDAQAGGEELLENPLKQTSLLLWAGSAWFRCCSHQVSSVILQKVGRIWVLLPLWWWLHWGREVAGLGHLGCPSSG